MQWCLLEQLVIQGCGQMCKSNASRYVTCIQNSNRTHWSNNDPACLTRRFYDRCPCFCRHSIRRRTRSILHSMRKYWGNLQRTRPSMQTWPSRSRSAVTRRLKFAALAPITRWRYETGRREEHRIAHSYVSSIRHQVKKESIARDFRVIRMNPDDVCLK